MRYLLAVMLLCSLSAFAKNTPKPTYMDGELLSFRAVTVGTSCTHTGKSSGDVDARENDNGYIEGTVSSKSKGSSDCSNQSAINYTISVGGGAFVVREIPRFLFRPGVLAHKMPHTKIQVRMESKDLRIRIGKDESKYEIIEAR